MTLGQLNSEKLKQNKYIGAARQFECNKLFEPGWIGEMELKNRIVKAATATNYGGEDGQVTQRIKEYYGRTARGGAGLIIVEGTCIDPTKGKVLQRMLCIDSDKNIEGLNELAQHIKKNGTKAVIQLAHGGREARSKLAGFQPLAPSPISSFSKEVPLQLDIHEITNIVNYFASAAERAKKSGFDGVEIHAAHGYLIAQFLSKASNRRKDRYGGSLKNRARILMEIIRAVKGICGEKYPVIVRINGCEYGIQNGFKLSEAQEIAKMSQDNGASAIHVSAYGHGLHSLVTTPLSSGFLIPLVGEIKRTIDIPVIAVGNITPELAEKILKDKTADFIAFGRALISCPDLPNKLQSAQLEHIRPCINCLCCLSHVVLKDEPLRCSVNASISGGEEYEIKPALQRKAVSIIGGGPAGMEAARVAALRGHKVVLYEKNDRLGGQLLAALKPPRKHTIQSLINYLEYQIRNLGVEVEVQKTVNDELIRITRPEVVVFATGSIPIIPDIPGLSEFDVLTVEEILVNEVEVGDKVIIIGGGQKGCEVAEILSDMGKQVTIVELLGRLAARYVAFIRAELLDSLRRKGVKILTGAECEMIAGNHRVVVRKGKKRQLMEADTIVLAVGNQPNNTLLNTLEEKIPEIYQIGDCVEPRGIMEAIDEGFRAACRI